MCVDTYLSFIFIEGVPAHVRYQIVRFTISYRAYTYWWRVIYANRRVSNKKLIEIEIRYQKTLLSSPPYLCHTLV
jgi:hypothetical protein